MNGLSIFPGSLRPPSPLPSSPPPPKTEKVLCVLRPRRDELERAFLFFFRAPLDYGRRRQSLPQLPPRKI